MARLRGKLNLLGETIGIDLELEGMGFPLVWHNPEGRRMCRIDIRQNADFLNPEKWQEQHQGLQNNLEKFYNVFAPLVGELD